MKRDYFFRSGVFLTAYKVIGISSLTSKFISIQINVNSCREQGVP